MKYAEVLERGEKTIRGLRGDEAFIGYDDEHTAQNFIQCCVDPLIQSHQPLIEELAARRSSGDSSLDDDETIAEILAESEELRRIRAGVAEQLRGLECSVPTSSISPYGGEHASAFEELATVRYLPEEQCWEIRYFRSQPGVGKSEQVPTFNDVLGKFKQTV